MINEKLNKQIFLYSWESIVKPPTYFLHDKLNYEKSLFFTIQIVS